MFGHYKFLDSEHVDLVMGGSVRLSSLAWFRQLEARSASSWIGDEMEGMAFYSGTASSPNITPERLKRFGIQVENDSTVVVSDLTMVYPHCLIFCFSTGEYGSLRDVMCKDLKLGPTERYDAALRIRSAQRLLSRIYNEGRIAEFNDEFVRNHFQNAEVRDVSYGDRDTPIGGVIELELSPFAKRTHFRSQCEARIVLTPRDPRMRDQITIKFPRPDGVFELVERQIEGAPRLPRDKQKPHLIVDLNNLADDIDAFWAHRPRQDDWRLSQLSATER